MHLCTFDIKVFNYVIKYYMERRWYKEKKKGKLLNNNFILYINIYNITFLPQVFPKLLMSEVHKCISA